MIWREILKKLANSRDWTSSKLLCEKFNISRTAVWKHINYLEEKGFIIDSQPKRGYKLVFPKDTILALDEDSFEGQSFGKDIFHFISIDSTNAYAHQISDKVREGALVLTEQQTAGRGRKGRSWFSPFGKNIYFSIILKPDLNLTVLTRLTIVIGVSVAEALSKFKINVKLKWPNDIMIGHKKVGGILSELYSEGEVARYVILGVGINIHSEGYDFPEELRDIAGSIYSTTGARIDRCRLIIEIIKIFEEKYYSFISKDGDIEDIAKVWDEIAYGKDREIMITTGTGKQKGKIVGLKSDGALLANIDGVLKEIYAGEILI